MAAGIFRLTGCPRPLPSRRRIGAEDGVQDLATPGTEQPGQSDNFAGLGAQDPLKTARKTKGR